MNGDKQEGQKSVQIEEGSISLLDLLVILAKHKKKIVLMPILAGAIMGIYSSQIPKSFFAKTTIMPISPKALVVTASGHTYQESSESVKITAERLKTILKSRKVQDIIISRYMGETADVGSISSSKTREKLTGATLISVGRNDSVVTIEVKDGSPEKAARLANGYVFALSEVGFTNKKRLAPERQEISANMAKDDFSLLRGDSTESNRTHIVNEGGQNATIFQVLDVAMPPTKPAHTRRTQMVLLTVIGVGFMMCLVVFIMEARERTLDDPEKAKKIEELRRNLSRF